MSHFVLESSTIHAMTEVKQSEPIESAVKGERFEGGNKIVETKSEPDSCDDAASNVSYHDAAESEHSDESLSATAKKTQKSFVCDMCNFSSPDRNVLQLHWLSEHDPLNEFPCPGRHCKCRFKTQKELDLHSRIHVRRKWEGKNAICPSLCHICSKVFPTEFRLRIHLKIHQEKSFECDLCPLKFKTRQEVRIHILRHKGMFKLSAIRRLYPANYPAKLTGLSEKIADDRRPHKCQYAGCERKFKQLEQLNDHISVHLGINPHQCNHCSETFRTKNALTRHRVDVHKDFRRNWCQLCDKSFCNGKAMLQHNESHHSGSFPFACTYCEQQFRFKKQLIVHLEIHERVNCEACAKSVLIHKYEAHKLKHSTSAGEKPFKCEHPGCNASFKVRAYLNDHKNVHTNLRPHVCDICSEGFNYKSAMYHHRESHVNPDK